MDVIGPKDRREAEIGKRFGFLGLEMSRSGEKSAKQAAPLVAAPRRVRVNPQPSSGPAFALNLPSDISFWEFSPSLPVPYLRRAATRYRPKGQAVRLVPTYPRPGGVLFIDLRDHYGLTRWRTRSPAFKEAEKCAEWVVRIDGKVRRRPEGPTIRNCRPAWSKSTSARSGAGPGGRTAAAGVRRAGIS